MDLGKQTNYFKCGKPHLYNSISRILLYNSLTTRNTEILSENYLRLIVSCCPHFKYLVNTQKNMPSSFSPKLYMRGCRLKKKTRLIVLFVNNFLLILTTLESKWQSCFLKFALIVTCVEYIENKGTYLHIEC